MAGFIPPCLPICSSRNPFLSSLLRENWAMIRILAETAADHVAREALLDRSLGGARHTKTSERLREDRLPARGLAFSAKAGSRLVGTLRLWNISAGPGVPALLLGPLAVDADHRGAGIGSMLMDHAVAEAKARGHKAILLVGDAAYYSRFGFVSDAAEQLWLPGPVDRARFLALELELGVLSVARGMVSATGRKDPAPALRTLLRRFKRQSDFAIMDMAA
jgi:predicted N-acetyltransferase YhbS